MAAIDRPYAPNARADSTPSTRALALVAVVGAAALAALAVIALLLAHRSPLTSDESLYLSEGWNIAAGIGPKYTTHDLVQHRPFLFPALIALPMKLSGGFGSVYWLTKSVALLDAAVLALLVRRMFGTVAAVAAGILALSNRFLSGLGTTVYLDDTETLLLLLTLVALWESRARRSAPLAAAAGAALGLAFLTKEAALLWMPLPALFVLFTVEPRALPSEARRLAAFYATFAIVAGWWWLYVWRIDGIVYMWPGRPASLAAVAVSCVVLLTLAAFAYRALSARRPALQIPVLRAAAVLVLVGWVGVWTFVMETHSWPYPKDFVHTMPAYLRHVVAGNVAPWPLMAAAVVALFARARGDARYSLLALAFALWLPFAIFVANRNFALRDLLPMIYIGYAVAGVIVAELFAWLHRQADGPAAQFAAAAVVLVACAYVGAQSMAMFNDHRTDPPLASADWNNALVQDTASWLEDNVPPGTSLMSSRLYFSQLYIQTHGAYPIAQLPTVNVVPRPARTPYLEPRSTLFRWEEALLAPASADEHWISVDNYPEKHYYTALSQEDLIAQLENRRANYLIVTGEDVAFSTTRYLDYFFAQPAFTLVHHDAVDGAGETYIFHVDRAKLALSTYRTVIPGSVLQTLAASAAGRLDAAGVVSAINPIGVTVRPEDGLSPDLRAAVGLQVNAQ